MKSTFALPARHHAAPVLILVGLLAASILGFAAERKREPGRPGAPEMTPGPPPPRMDPQTGLPMPPQGPFFDPAWQDSGKILPQVAFDGLPLSEIARFLRSEFKDSFDVLIPGGWQDNAEQPRSVDPGSFTVKLQLKNVSAPEIFNAMNMVLEGENDPVRWELRMNGNRPTAVLRVLPDLIPRPAPFPAPEPPKRMIYFVGDMLGDSKVGGMDMEELVKMVSDIYEMSYGKGQQGKSHIQFHKGAQLIIVNGTADQTRFIQETLRALRQKGDLERASKVGPGLKGPSPTAKPKAEESQPQ